MHSQFVLLTELQHIDDQLQALRKEQQALPAMLQEAQQTCDTMQQQLTVLQTEIEQSERQQRSLDREIETSQGALAKTQAKLHEVKTNKEYTALLAEIATGKTRIAALEDQLLQILEFLDQQHESLQRHEQDIHLAAEHLAGRRLAMQKAETTLLQRLARLDEKRQHTIADLDTTLVNTYEKLATQYGGRAVAHLQDGVCDGCHLKVQPQLISQIRMQETLLTCPHCRLMLLWPVAEPHDDTYEKNRV